jgi:hypothetical protein
MNFVIVPDTLSKAINDKLDIVLNAMPPEAEASRAGLYQQLLSFYNENGYLPEFTVTKNADQEETK